MTGITNLTTDEIELLTLFRELPAYARRDLIRGLSGELRAEDKLEDLESEAPRTLRFVGVEEVR